MTPPRTTASRRLGLLFDLVFVVAVSQASQNLHHLISEDHVGQGVLSYLMIFFAIWWAWMNFTWFASAFDTDDWLYRVMTVSEWRASWCSLRECTRRDGGLRLPHRHVGLRDHAAGDGGAVAEGSGIRSESRPTALQFALGIAVVQALWLARVYLLDEQWQFWTFFVLVVAELAVPVWAESHRRTSWHPHHIIAERFGLFTLLLLGESLLASANAMIDALSEASAFRNFSASPRAAWSSPPGSGGCTSLASSTGA